MSARLGSDSASMTTGLYSKLRRNEIEEQDKEIIYY